MFHFELILVHAVRYGSKIFVLFCFDFTREHPVVIAPFVEQTMNCLCSFVNNQLFMYAGIHFWTLHSVPFIYLSILTAIPNCLGYYSFIINLDKSCVCPLTLFFYKVVLSVLGPLNFHMNFRNSLLISI